MKIKKLLISSLYLLLTLCSSLHGQAPDSIVGQTITFNYQSTSVGGESGTARFSLFEGGKAWEYDTDDGEWESPTYQWEPSAGKGEFVIIWGELEYVNISLSFDSALTGTFTYVSWDDNGTGISSIEDEGIGDFVISSASEFNKPPFERYFSDDFTNPSVTRENFHFADGDTSQGLTIEQNSSGYYTIRGLFTGEEDGDNPHDRWFEISAIISSSAPVIEVSIVTTSVT